MKCQKLDTSSSSNSSEKPSSKMNSKGQTFHKMAKHSIFSHTMQKLVILAEISSKRHSGSKFGCKPNHWHRNPCCMHHQTRNALCQPKPAKSTKQYANHHVMTTTASTKVANYCRPGSIDPYNSTRSGIYCNQTKRKQGNKNKSNENSKPIGSFLFANGSTPNQRCCGRGVAWSSACFFSVWPATVSSPLPSYLFFSECNLARQHSWLTDLQLLESRWMRNWISKGKTPNKKSNSESHNNNDSSCTWSLIWKVSMKRSCAK